MSKFYWEVRYRFFRMRKALKWLVLEQARPAIAPFRIKCEIPTKKIDPIVRNDQDPSCMTVSKLVIKNGEPWAELFGWDGLVRVYQDPDGTLFVEQPATEKQAFVRGITKF